MKNYYVSFSIPLMILIFSCSTLNNQTKKNYVFTTTNGLLTHKLILHQDHHFDYSLLGDMQNLKSEGEWQAEGKNLYLKSYSSYKTNDFVVKKSSTNHCNTDSVYIVFKDQHTIPLANVVIKYQKNSFMSDNTGKVKFVKGKDSIVNISFLDYNLSYLLSDSLSNCQEIELRQKDRSKIYFDNDAWKVYRNKIVSGSGLILYKEK